MRVIIVALLVAASAALAYFAPVRTNVAVFGRTLRPCPPRCETWNGQIKEISRSEIVL
jgi:hypothetical protein